MTTPSETALSAEEERKFRESVAAIDRAVGDDDYSLPWSNRVARRLLATLDAARSQPATEGLREALAKYGEHQHEWVRFPMKVFENGEWRDAREPEEGWDRMVVRQMCPDQTGECWCGLRAALAATEPAATGETE